MSLPRHCSTGVWLILKAVYLYIAVAVMINTTVCQDLNLGPLTLQSDMLPRDHCNPHEYMNSMNIMKPLRRCFSSHEETSIDLYVN